MVGYEPKHEVHLSPFEHIAAGATSGGITRAICQPFDVLKIRFQLQIEPVDKHRTESKYRGIIQASHAIFKEEGITAFWKGHIAAQYLSITYGLVQFGVFELLTKRVWNYLPHHLTVQYKPLTHTACGGLAGCVSIIVVQPFDVLRTRFVAQGQQKEYRSFSHAIKSIHHADGVRGFYRGLGPAVIAISPQIGLQFGFYATFIRLWEKVFSVFDNKPPGIMESLVCGSGAGIMSKVIVYPLDVAKKRLQIQGFEEARKTFGKFTKYSGLIDCLVTIVREESLLGLFKGLSPGLLKAAVVTGMHFCTYEQICLILAWNH